jgi:hypothetical protein
MKRRLRPVATARQWGRRVKGVVKKKYPNGRK